MRSLFRLLMRVVIALAIVTVTIILVRAVDSRKLPDLRVWHTVELESEYRASRDGDIDGFAAYLAQEQRVFDELDEKIYSQVPVRFVDSLPEVLRPAVDDDLGITSVCESGS